MWLFILTVAICIDYLVYELCSDAIVLLSIQVNIFFLFNYNVFHGASHHGVMFHELLVETVW